MVADTLSLGGGTALINLPSGPNFFDGGAGNTTLSGTSNFGTGTNALGSLTTGAQNCAVGVSALAACQDGSRNLAVGQGALQNNVSGSAECVAIGVTALQVCTNFSNRRHWL